MTALSRCHRVTMVYLSNFIVACQIVLAPVGKRLRSVATEWENPQCSSTVCGKAHQRGSGKGGFY